MKKNVGSIDKLIRVILVISIAVMYFTAAISGTVALVLGAFAVILLITSFLSFCPLYYPFGINTKEK